MDAIQTNDGNAVVLAQRFTIVRTLGHGAHGVVYLALDALLNNAEVALKVLHPHVVRDRKLRAQILKEVRISRRFSHPRLAKFHEILRLEDELSGEQILLVMEYVAGTPLRTIIENRAQCSVHAHRISVSIAEALTAMHSINVIHGDIKPDNIIISASGDAKLVDFGSAAGLNDTSAGVYASLPYLAPEIESRPTVAGDIFALGVILSELSSQFSVFSRRRRQILAIGRRCMAATPDKRYASASAVHAALVCSQRSAFSLRSVLKWILFTGMFVLTMLVLVTRSNESVRETASYYWFSHIPASRPTDVWKQILGLHVSEATLATALVTNHRTELLSQFIARLREKVSFQTLGAHLLRHAYSVSNYEAGRILHDAGARIDPAQHLTAEVTILQSILLKGEAQWLRLVLDHNWSGGTEATQGHPPIQYAMQREDVALLRELLALGARIVDGGQYSMLTILTSVEDQEFIALLIASASEADINWTDRHGHTALTYAIADGRADITRLLLQARADPSIIDNTGLTPIHHVRSANREVVELLQNSEPVDLNALTTRSETPLRHSIGAKNYEVVSSLLRAGVDLRIRNSDGQSALEFAESEQLPAFAEMVLTAELEDYLSNTATHPRRLLTIVPFLKHLFN